MNKDDDVIIESSSSAPGTPSVSNPGTPRSVVDEVRSTPPPGVRNTPPPGHRNTPPPPGMSRSSSASQMSSASAPQSITSASAAAQRTYQPPQLPQSKYALLLNCIEDMGKDIRPTYSGSRTSAERLKRGIVHARILVRECLMECERAARS